jgi:peptidylprolyl isomerase
MKTHTQTLPGLILALAALPLGAQTAATHPAAATHPVHHTATTTTTGCVKVPEISSKIPALAASAPCARALYTITHTSDVHLDYASPLVSPELRAELSGEKTTYTLSYIDTVIGTGALAQPGKFYTVNYTGYLVDGTKFDSSLAPNREPITFPYGQHRVIAGWDSGFEGMHIGGKRRLFIPYQLAYGATGHPPTIPAKSELIFDVEFIAQSDEMPKPKPPAVRQPMVPPTAKPLPATTTPPPAAAKPAAATTTQPQPQK